MQMFLCIPEIFLIQERVFVGVDELSVSYREFCAIIIWIKIICNTDETVYSVYKFLRIMKIASLLNFGEMYFFPAEPTNQAVFIIRINFYILRTISSVLQKTLIHIMVAQNYP